jgi:hypothetical protein
MRFVSRDRLAASVFFARLVQNSVVFASAGTGYTDVEKENELMPML